VDASEAFWRRIESGADRLMSVRTSRRRVIELVAVADHDHDHVNEHGPWSLTLSLTLTLSDSTHPAGHPGMESRAAEHERQRRNRPAQMG
jgi:hypothetical protein